VLGDPMNVELTKAIIDLGWKPPTIRTKWDVLPIVTMAQLDFEKPGLRLVPAPVLSRLGFSIGGV
jgi:nitric oxide synthase oxygenase domain/subunit